ncbi:MAG: hypothetical protein AAGI66_04290 [Cyanobacteria bacterium P01_H01_bin.74]
MQKVFLKIMAYELMERLVRLKSLLTDTTYLDASSEYQAVMGKAGQASLQNLERQFFSHHNLLMQTCLDSGKKQVDELYSTLCPAFLSVKKQLDALTKLMASHQALRVLPETQLFLKDSIPSVLLDSKQAQSVFLTTDNQFEAAVTEAGTQNFLMDLPEPLDQYTFSVLPLLQRNNPLAWVGLAQSFSEKLIQTVFSAEKQRLNALLSLEPGKGLQGLQSRLIALFLPHAVQLRLMGPAYYLHLVSEALVRQDVDFLATVEPVLFFGLNHQNHMHKRFVLIHEACERSRGMVHREKRQSQSAAALTDEVMTSLFAVTEKILPGKHAFLDKHFQRAGKLQSRLSQGLFISSSPVYPVSEVSAYLSEHLPEKQQPNSSNSMNTEDQQDFSIYTPLAMMTEYPHSPREIVNTGWLHKMENLSEILYSSVSQQSLETLEKQVAQQDHRLCKSIEVSEVHRMLLYTG